MKRHIYIVCALLLGAMSLGAQELQRLSEPDLIGSARYIGMAGAMTAVGGDPSAIQLNPAGLGIYRRFEAGVTFGGRYTRTSQSTNDGPGGGVGKVGAFNLPQVTFVFAFGNDEWRQGLVYNNIAFSYNRLSSFSRRTPINAYTGGSCSEQMAASAAGVPVAAMGDANAWDNSSIGWLSILGYNTYMIDPMADSLHWKPYNNWNKDLERGVVMTESGYLDQYSINWGGNLSNRWYIGLGFNIRSLYYSKNTEYQEVRADGSWASVSSTMSQSGVGVNGAVGVMWHPIRALRLGASFMTPSIVTTSFRTYGIAESNGIYDDGTHTFYRSETPEYYEKMKLRMPLRLSVGAAFILRQFGLISLQYDYQTDTDIADCHSLRLGTEWVIRERGFLNVGYACTFSPKAKDYIYRLADNDVRTDIGGAAAVLKHHVGAAIGYRGPFAFVQIGYCWGWQRHQFVGPIDDSAISSSHDIVLTIGWHSSK